MWLYASSTRQPLDWCPGKQPFDRLTASLSPSHCLTVPQSHRLTVSPCHRLLLLPRLLLRFMHDRGILLRHGKQLRGRNRSVWHMSHSSHFSLSKLAPGQEFGSSPSTDTGQQWRRPQQARSHASAGLQDSAWSCVAGGGSSGTTVTETARTTPRT